MDLQSLSTILFKHVERMNSLLLRLHYLLMIGLKQVCLLILICCMYCISLCNYSLTYTHIRVCIGFAVFLDNGIGMTETQITYFATHSLNQTGRNVLDKKYNRVTSETKSKKSVLSKFGVGAKQAGLYI